MPYSGRMWRKKAEHWSLFLCMLSIVFINISAAFISKVNTVHMKSIIHDSIAMISLNLYTLAGFEPGSYFLESDATPRAPCCKGSYLSIVSFQQRN
jgi:hypothetical protein